MFYWLYAGILTMLLSALMDLQGPLGGIGAFITMLGILVGLFKLFDENHTRSTGPMVVIVMSVVYFLAGRVWELPNVFGAMLQEKNLYIGGTAAGIVWVIQLIMAIQKHMANKPIILKER